jgi:hypothetical protein
MVSKNLNDNPQTLGKEVSVLYELGLKEYEIEYIIYLKYKEELSEKWTN